MIDALLERRCPFCDSKSYGGGSTPKVLDGLVYRRRLCLDEAKCGRQFVVVEGVISDNSRLARALGDYHAECADGLSPEERGDAA